MGRTVNTRKGAVMGEGECGMTEQRETGAVDMWRARQGVVIRGIAVAQYHRTELDQARADVERLSIEAAELRAEVANLTAERDRARDLAARSGAFDEYDCCTHFEQERDQALYERDAALARVNR